MLRLVVFLFLRIFSLIKNFYHSHKYLDLSKNIFQKILIQNCKKFPIKIIDFNNKLEVQVHNTIVKLVDQLLQLNKDLQSATLPEQKERLKLRIGYCEDKINKIVYELYGLTEEEIGIIENN